MMRKFYIIILLISGIYYLQAQVRFVDDSLIINKTDKDDLHFKFDIRNKDYKGRHFYWKVSKTSFNPTWQSRICVKDFCFDYNKDMVSSPVDIKANGLVDMTLIIKHHHIPDTALIVIKLYSDRDLLHPLDSLPVFVNISKANLEKKPVTAHEIMIYPNPAVEYFHIDSEKEIKKIDMFNLIGRKVRTLYNNGSNVYDISDMRKGIYLLRIFDKDNRVLKVARLSISDRQP